MGYGFFAPGLVMGTMVFAVLGAIGLGVAFAMAHETPKTTKGEMRIMGMVSVAIATVCMWMFWAFTYMHQMVPLIYPIHAKVTGAN